MASVYQNSHHQAIESALRNFSSDYLIQNNILFGGGTRIALELGEFRESVDIDFFCPDSASYRAVRSQVTNLTLGKLVHEDFNYLREIRADRDAVRCMIDYEGTTIKVEFVSLLGYTLKRGDDLFPVPCVDRASCYYTKLLANADRYGSFPYKDVIDICAMVKEWGCIPEEAISLAEEQYSEQQIIPNLVRALENMLSNTAEHEKAANAVCMKDSFRQAILTDIPPKLIERYKS